MVRHAGWRLVAFFVGFSLVAALVPRATAAAQPAAPAKSPSNVSPRLGELSDEPGVARSRVAENRLAGLPARGAGSLLHQPDGRFLVNARLTKADAATEAALVAAGAKVTARSIEDHLVTLAIGSADIENVGTVAGVEWLEEILEPTVGRADRSQLADVLRQGDVATSAVCGSRIISEADTHLAVATARSVNSVDGTGVKVGVLSDSYNNRGGAASSVAAGELPGPGNPCGRTTPVTVRSELGSGGSDEGRAMAEAVHDLAPGAHILVASAFKGDVDFANQIRNLAAAGAKVIVDDISYFNESIYQDGIIAKAVADVTALGVTYFSSAANTNKIIGGNDVASYEAQAYRPTACPARITAIYRNSDCHDFNPAAGVSAGNAFTLDNDGTLRVKLGWNEPAFGLTTDLDLFIVDAVTDTVVAQSNLDNPGTTKLAYEDAWFMNTTGEARSYRVVVSRYKSSAMPRFKTIHLSTAGVTAVQWNVSAGGDIVGPSGYGHNMMRSMGSIAAIKYDTTTAPEDYSSRGPATYCWNPIVGTTAASALPSCVTSTVTLTATDGARNSFFGEADGGIFRFFGTSQAAPHAAAIAVLQVQARPCRTPVQILAAQQASAVPVGAFGVNAVGAGRVQAPAAISGLALCPVAPGPPTGVSGTPGIGQVSLSWSAPASNGGSAITGYRVTPRIGGSAQPVRVFNSAATAQSITGLANGTTYTFVVRAVNAAGTGAASAASASIVTVPTSSSPFANANALVTRIFTDLIGRAPTAAERNGYVARLEAGSLTRGGFVAELRSSSDHLTNVDPVTRLYRAYLLRIPDRSGLTFWIRQHRVNGKSLNAISSSFAASNEFKTKYGSLGNRAFVELIYQNVLGRPGEASGVDFWTSRLDRRVNTRGQVMTGFSESGEYKTKQASEVDVSVIYILLLGRAPTTAEFDALVDALDDEVKTRASIAGDIIESEAYATRING